VTELIAMVAGPYLIATGLGFLISTGFYTRMVADNAAAHPVTLNLSGAVHFVVGMVIVAQHLRFGSLAEGVVSVLGLAAVLKGLALIVVPALTLRSPKSSGATLRVSGVAYLLAGAYLSYVGYFA